MAIGCVLAGLAASGLSCRRQSADSARKVVLYCSVDQAVAEPIIAEFERRTGIRVLTRFDTEASKTVGLVHLIEARADEPVADVFWSSEVFYTIRLARQGLLGSYRGDVTKDWPKRLADAKGRWYGRARRFRRSTSPWGCRPRCWRRR